MIIHVIIADNTNFKSILFCGESGDEGVELLTMAAVATGVNVISSFSAPVTANGEKPDVCALK